jgi:hypothetical protein
LVLVYAAPPAAARAVFGTARAGERNQISVALVADRGRSDRSLTNDELSFDEVHAGSGRRSGFHLDRHFLRMQ